MAEKTKRAAVARPPPVFTMRIADCGLRIADCGLRIADCGLRIAERIPNPESPIPNPESLDRRIRLRLRREDLLERGHEPRHLLGRADRHAHVLRHRRERPADGHLLRREL